MTQGNQIFVFFACVACGIASGLLYDAIYLVRYPFHACWVRAAGDILFFLLFAAGYLFVSVLFSLPAFRVYMFAGCILGLLLYLKSFHKIVAFFTEKLYNGITHKKTNEDRTAWPKRKRRAFRRKKQEGSQ